MQTLRFGRSLVSRHRKELQWILPGVDKLQHPALCTAVKNRLIVGKNNIIRSGFPDVPDGFDNLLLHELVWRDLEKWPDKVAMVCAATGKFYTYHQLRNYCGRFATSLRKSKLLPGETIAVALPNIPEYPIALLGAVEAGLCPTTLNPVNTPQELSRQLRDSDAVAVITSSSKYDALRKSIEGNAKIRMPIIVVKDEVSIPSGCINFEDLIRNGIEEFSENEKTDRVSQDTVMLPYSSGTTGLPKGVEISHRNVVANLEQCAVDGVWPAQRTTSDFQEVVPLNLPAFHVYGLIVILCYHLKFGCKIVCLPKFTPKDFLDLLKTYEPTLLCVVPPMVQMMAQSPQVTKEHVKSLNHIISGAAPLGKQTISLFQEHTGSSAKFIQGYGLTEASPIISVTVDAPFESVGCLVPNTELRIVETSEGSEERNLGVHMVGEMRVKGPQVMKGYYKNPEATADTMDGEWLKTGDLACYDQNGRFYIKGRLKELIKVKGYQVSPAELEELIRGLDKVQDVAVIGIPHKEHGETPKAFVVPKKDVKLRGEEVKEFVAKQVSKYKHLGEVEFVNNIPKNATGKILRKELQNM